MSTPYKGKITRLSTHGNNDLVHSELTRFDDGLTSSPVFGIKYVASGRERYILNHKVHEVSEGQYLLVNKGQSFECNFKSDQAVHGYCIGIDETMIAGVHHDLQHTEESLLDDPFNTTSFDGLHELVYSSGNELGSFIRQFIAGDDDQHESAYDLFYQVTVRLLHAHKHATERIAKLKARRSSTKKELFSRLEQARQLLDECTDQALPVAGLAKKAALSEFHFYRSFKAVYGLSPHQYLLQQKLTRAARMVKEGKLSITDIAYQVGFNDIYSFSKAFRQYFGVPPTKFT